jgi:hypothetical protein
MEIKAYPAQVWDSTRFPVQAASHMGGSTSMDGARSVMPRDVDLATFRAVPLEREPFEYLVVPAFIKREALARINADHPKISERAAFRFPRSPMGQPFRLCSTSWKARARS